MSWDRFFINYKLVKTFTFLCWPKFIIILIIIFCTSLPIANSFAKQKSGNKIPYIAITSIDKSTPIDSIFRGMVDYMSEHGYVEGKSIRYNFEEAKNDQDKAAQLINKFKNDNASIIVALTYPSALIALKKNLSIPIVFAGVDLDNMVKLLRHNNAKSVYGVTKTEDYSTLLELILEITPEIKTILLPYKPNNDEKIREAISRLKIITSRKNLDLEKFTVKSNYVIGTKNKITSPTKNSVFLIDKKLYPEVSIEQIINIAKKNKTLVFASDEQTVLYGALATIIIDPYAIGLEIGHIIKRVLENPSSLNKRIYSAKRNFIVINNETALQTGIDIPETILNKRVRVVEWANKKSGVPKEKPIAPHETTSR
jgi:putative ABC transport system substrate-binding protein